MNVIYNDATYECAVAVKCEADRYIKLYDSEGVEIVAFYGITDFSAFTTNGSWSSPCTEALPIALTSYTIGGKTISTSDWKLKNNQYYVEISNELISANVNTCNIVLFFAEGTELTYTATQEAGKITLYTAAAPLANIVIESIQITRV